MGHLRVMRRWLFCFIPHERYDKTIMILRYVRRFGVLCVNL